MHPQLYGNQEIGLLKPSENYALIKEKTDKDSHTIDTLYKNIFFRFNPNGSSKWNRVYKFWNISDYFIKNKILNIKNLKNNRKTTLIKSIFHKELVLYSKSIKRDSPGLKEKAVSHHEERFCPILELFISEMRNSFDKDLMRSFFNIIIAESRYASEKPSWAIGYIYIYKTEKVLNLIDNYDNNRSVIASLRFGFANAVEETNFENQKIETLRKKLNDLP